MIANELGHSVHEMTLRSLSEGSKVGTQSLPLLYLWLAFQIIDQTLIPILVATFLLSKSVKRHPTLVNSCVTWVISGITSSLLLYAGKEKGPEPPKLLCTLQASLLDGLTPMTSVAILILTYQVNLNVRKPETKESRLRTYAFLIIPYTVLFLFSVSAAALATDSPEKVSRARRFFYCSIDAPISDAFSVFTAIVLLLTMAYAVVICVFLYKHWRDFRKAVTYDLQLLSRVGLFGIYVFLAFTISVLALFNPRNPFPDLFAASVGPVFGVILASQPDVYRVWLRRSKPVLPPFVEQRNDIDLEKSNTNIGFKDPVANNSSTDDDRVLDIRRQETTVSAQ